MQEYQGSPQRGRGGYRGRRRYGGGYRGGRRGYRGGRGGGDRRNYSEGNEPHSEEVQNEIDNDEQTV